MPPLAEWYDLRDLSHYVSGLLGWLPADRGGPAGAAATDSRRAEAAPEGGDHGPPGGPAAVLAGAGPDLRAGDGGVRGDPVWGGGGAARPERGRVVRDRPA